MPVPHRSPGALPASHPQQRHSTEGKNIERKLLNKCTWAKTVVVHEFELFGQCSQATIAFVVTRGVKVALWLVL